MLPGDQIVRPIQFHNLANVAFYRTLDALDRFERNDALGGSVDVLPGIAMWFIAVESFIATVFKLAVHAGEVQSDGQQDSRVTERYEQVISAYGAETASLSRTRKRLREFAEVRNAIFHDLEFAPDHKFVHTNFASAVAFTNEADLLEALCVSTEVFHSLRYVFPSLDLMPSIQLGETVEKLDVLVGEVALAAYDSILRLKGLGSTVGLQVAEPLRDVSTLQPLLVIKYEGAMAPRAHLVSPRGTTKELFDRAKAARPVDPELFRVPDYVRRRPPSA